MKRTKLSRKAMIAAIGAISVAGIAIAAPALAQRDPAYEAARAQGKVGEKMDGYLAVVGASTPDLDRIVKDINIKRRAVYAEKAQAANATLEEYAFTAGCLNISRTQPGEKYQAPGGTWQTRGSGAPQRDPRCP